LNNDAKNNDSKSNELEIENMSFKRWTSSNLNIRQEPSANSQLESSLLAQLLELLSNHQEFLYHTKKLQITIIG